MTTPVAPPSDIPAEDRDIYEQLAKLQDIYKQAFELRTLLPDRLVGPTRAILENSDTLVPQKVAANLKDAAVTGSKNIKHFKLSYQSDEMRGLWQKVNSSEFPQGEDEWTQNYSSLIGASALTHDELVDPKEEVKREDVESEDEEVLRKFQQANPTFGVKSIEDAQPLPFELIVDGVRLLVEAAGSEPRRQWRVKPNDATSLPPGWGDILKYIEQNHSSGSLESMLTLLSSYQIFKTATCQKCGKVFDENLQFALGRKRKQGSTSEVPLTWISFHESCTA